MPMMLPALEGKGGERHDTCPRRLLYDDHADFAEAMHLYALYDKGVLLYSGGLQDQPKPYLDLMRIITSAVNEVENELTERAKRKTA